MNGENSSPIEKLVEFQQDQQLTSQANATPLPGPLRDAFAVVPEILVGTYKVRPFADRDFEYLQALDNPLHKHINGQDSVGDLVRGQPAWELCYLLTHPFKEVKELFKTKGVAGFKEAAMSEFEEFQLSGLLEIIGAVMKQLEIFWAPVVGFKSTEGADDSKKNTLVDGTDKPATVTDGALKNAA